MKQPHGAPRRGPRTGCTAGSTELLAWEEARCGTWLWGLIFLSREGFTEKRFRLTLSPAQRAPPHSQCRRCPGSPSRNTLHTQVRARRPSRNTLHTQVRARRPSRNALHTQVGASLDLQVGQTPQVVVLKVEPRPRSRTLSIIPSGGQQAGACVRGSILEGVN